MNSIIGKELFDGKERQYVAKLLAEIDDKQLEVAAILAEIRELIEVKRDLLEAEQDSYLISLNGIQLLPHFEANGFLVRRVKENKKNIGKVRYALKELGFDKAPVTLIDYESESIRTAKTNPLSKDYIVKVGVSSNLLEPTIKYTSL